MKKFITIFLATSLLFIAPASAMAQSGTTTVDDSALNSATQDVPERKSVQFDQPSASSGETTSGYTDENGKPLSYDEFIKKRQEMDKGVFEKYPIPSALVVLAIVGGITYLVIKRKKKKA